MTAPVVIGLDLSLTGSGVASSAGWCERVGMPDVTTKPLDERLYAVDDLTAKIVLLVGRATPVALVCVELPAFSRAGGGVLERSALWWRVVRYLRLNHQVAVAEVPIQARMRYATGKAMASKGAIVDAVARRWPQFETNGDDNLADAAVLAALGADRLGVPLAPMPQTHRKAFDVIRWPDGLSASVALQNPVPRGPGSPDGLEALSGPPAVEDFAAVGGL